MKGNDVMSLVVFVVLGFAAFRLTRALIIDTLFEGTRHKFHTYLVNKPGIFWQKLHDLTSCSWCFGFWICLIVYSLYVWQCPVGFNQRDWINVFAVAGFQGILHALEPGED